ncbi:MAG TPA: acyl-CoA carboxylase subunit epsilon [Nocardioidaceae bacterium]|nr:acyl-CoA carboxylase subunit epsilon [Nocardioidaceae bacterium]
MSDAPPLFVVHGDATAEEIAALTAVLTALAGSAAPPAAVPLSRWASPARLLAPVGPGPGSWRASALPL